MTSRTRTNAGLLRSAAASALLCLSPAALTGVIAAPAAVAQEAAYPLIIDATQLRELAEDGAKIIDLRPADAYASGHIPGAINVPARSLIAPERDGLRNEFGSDEQLTSVFSAAGLSYDDTLVLYDSQPLPGYSFVVFEYAGFENVHVLDGGIAVWNSALSTQILTPEASQFTLDRPNDPRIDQTYVASRIGSEGTVIIDGRSEAAFEDGHIPTATAFPSGSLFSEQATLRDAPDLLNSLATAGIDSAEEVISYCGSGPAAAINYLALRNLGYENVVFYDGSWDEWSRDPEAGQELSLANYAFAPEAAAVSEGPRFLAADELYALIGDPGVTILDVRSGPDYNVGRIPGAVHVYWNDTLDENRVIKPLAELAALYEQAGVTPDQRVVIFTRGGVQLSHTYTVLTLLGYENVDFYTGRFEGWDTSAPS